MAGNRESVGRVDTSQLLDRGHRLIRSIPECGTGPEVIGARVGERVGWPPGSISLRAAGAPVGTACAEWLALNGCEEAAMQRVGVIGLGKMGLPIARISSIAASR